MIFGTLGSSLPKRVSRFLSGRWTVIRWAVSETMALRAVRPFSLMTALLSHLTKTSSQLSKTLPIRKGGRMPMESFFAKSLNKAIIAVARLQRTLAKASTPRRPTANCWYRSILHRLVESKGYWAMRFGFGKKPPQPSVHQISKSRLPRTQNFLNSHLLADCICVQFPEIYLEMPKPNPLICRQIILIMFGSNEKKCCRWFPIIRLKDNSFQCQMRLLSGWLAFI